MIILLADCIRQKGCAFDLDQFRRSTWPLTVTSIAKGQRAFRTNFCPVLHGRPTMGSWRIQFAALVQFSAYGS